MTEFQIIRREIQNNKERFIARLTRNLRKQGSCMLWKGRRGGGGEGRTYAFMNFRVNGRVQPFLVHRIFLALRLCRPINRFMEAGHYFCHNPICVVHVQEQTRSGNMKDANGRREEKRTRARASH